MAGDRKKYLRIGNQLYGYQWETSKIWVPNAESSYGWEMLCITRKVFYPIAPEGSAAGGGIVGGNLWYSVSNNLNGAGFMAAGMEYSGSRALSRTLAYTNTNSLVKPSQVMFKVPGGSVYTSTKFVSGATKALKVGGYATGLIGLGLTGYEVYTGQKSLIGEGGLDLIMGGVAFIPGGGWVVSGLYFGGKIFLEYTGYDFWNKP